MNEIKITGCSNDLLFTDEKNNYKSIRLCFSDIEDEDVMMELTSFDVKNEHKTLNNFLDKKIEMKITVIE